VPDTALRAESAPAVATEIDLLPLPGAFPRVQKPLGSVRSWFQCVGGVPVRTRPRLRPVLVELGGRTVRSQIVASDAEEPARVSMRVRDKGWSPYRVRFDDSQAAWVVSTFDWSNPPTKRVE
jgi:hypothetical protein